MQWSVLVLVAKLVAAQYGIKPAENEVVPPANSPDSRATDFWWRGPDSPFGESSRGQPPTNNPPVDFANNPFLGSAVRSPVPLSSCSSQDTFCVPPAHCNSGLLLSSAPTPTKRGPCINGDVCCKDKKSSQDHSSLSSTYPTGPISYPSEPQRPHQNQGSYQNPGSYQNQPSSPHGSSPSQPSAQPGHFPSKPSTGSSPNQPGHSPNQPSPQPGHFSPGYSPSQPSSHPSYFQNRPTGYPNQPSTGSAPSQPSQVYFPNQPSNQPGHFPSQPSNQPGHFPSQPSSHGSSPNRPSTGSYQNQPSPQGSYPNQPRPQTGSYQNQPSPQPGSYSSQPSPQPAPQSKPDSQVPAGGEVTGPPYPGCAAALKCVDVSYCTLEGVISPTPTQLTRDQIQHRVPLTSCQDLVTGLVGKCCRDPNFKPPPGTSLDDGFYRPEHHDGPQQKPYNDGSYLQPPHFDDGSYKQPGSAGPYNQPSYDDGSYKPNPGSFQQPQTPSLQQPGKPSFQQPQTPSFQQPQTPPFQQPGKPSFQQPQTPSYQQPQTPSFQQPGKPSFQQPQNPSYQQPQTPSFQQPQTPSFQQPQTPSFQQPQTPSFQQPQTPSFQQPQTPSFQQPHTPSFQQPHTPSFQQPQTPSFQQPSPGSYQQPANQGNYRQPSNTGPYNQPSYEGSFRQPNPPLPAVPSPTTGCGVRKQPQSANGDIATSPNEFPWQASVLSSKNASGLCSAAVISDNAVITSAQCLQGKDASDVEVLVGNEKKRVAAVVNHPSFDSGSLAKDEAVLVLAEPLQGPVTEACTGEEPTMGPCYITGWGRPALKEGGPRPNGVHKLEVILVPEAQCQQALQDTYLGKQFILSEGSLCAVPAWHNTTFCQVDVGSPLVCLRQDGRYQLMGVYSWDTRCAAKNPAVFAPCDYPWIQQVVSTPVDNILADQQRNVPTPDDFRNKPGLALGYGK